ncbi:NDR1/HIN1-like protein 10 [Selaginella moellendorffii]|nr:NDR1/HIN1-like protein 10 [Selaginella moellendorffii]|eukprot:XP_024537169.1 NDR1/HIN1-like protein 10 [Selaginella moellendorffii]
MTDRIHPAASPSAPILEESKRLNGAYQQKIPDQLFPPHPAAYVPPARRRSRRCCGGLCRCLCWLLALVVIIVILLGITALVFWLVIRPVRSPSYNVQDVSPVFTISTDSNPPLLDAIVSFTVRAENPNRRIGIYYDRVAIYLYYAGLQVGESSIDPFYQGHRDVRFLRSNLTTTDLPLTQELATSLRNDIAQNRVPLDVRVRVKARVKIGALKSPRVKVRSHCSVVVRPDGAGLLERNCRVRVRL